MLWVCCPTYAKLPVNIGPYSQSQGLPKMVVVPYKTRAFFSQALSPVLLHFGTFLMGNNVPFSNARRLYFFAPVILFSILLQAIHEFFQSIF